MALDQRRGWAGLSLRWEDGCLRRCRAEEVWGQREEERAWAHQVLKLHLRCFS